MLKYKISKLLTNRKLAASSSGFAILTMATKQLVVVCRKPFVNGFYVCYFVVTSCHLL